MHRWKGRTSALVHPPIAQVSRLAAQLRSQGQEQIDLGQAIVALPPPEKAMKEAIAYAQTREVHGYGPDPGLPILREKIAGYLRSVKGSKHAEPSNVMVTCGANQAFANTIFALTQPNDEVITLDPGYFDHSYVLQLAGCREVPVALRITQEGFDLALSDLKKAWSPQTRAVVVVTPGNPTGVLASQPLLEELATYCRQHNAWLIVDETYDLLTYDPWVHASGVTLEPFDNVVVIGSFSKSLGLAGWRVGYCCGPDEFMDEALKVQDALVVCAPSPSQLAVAAILDDIDTVATLLRRELSKRRDALLSGVSDWNAVEFAQPKGGTFVFGRLRNTTDDVGFCEGLLRECGVVTVPGSAFGRAGVGWIRVSYGNQNAERLAVACDRIRGFR